MSDSPAADVPASTKRPLEEEPLVSGANEQPDAKRQALDKAQNEGADDGKSDKGATDTPADEVKLDIKAEDDTNSNVNGHKDDIASALAIVKNEQQTGTGAAATAGIEPQPIPTAGHIDPVAQGIPPQHGRQDESNFIHIRAVISSAEAATAIGKGGENVVQVRRLSGAKCTVSDYSRGAVERILTVSGLVDAVAKVRKLVCNKCSSIDPDRLLD